jgi:hypothetical protein
MQEITKDRLQRNLNFLSEVYEITKGDFVSLNQRELTKKHKLGNNIFTTLFSNGWLIKKGNKGSSVYIWKVGEPNIRTSRKFIENCSKNIILYKEGKKQSELKKVSNKKIIEPIKNNKNIPFVRKQIEKSKEIRNKEFSLMWGLITIKY